MAGNAPNISEVRAAIDLYLGHAFAGDADLPHAVAAIVQQIRDADDAEVLSLPMWERDGAQPACRYCLRLGNRYYPHMKLVLERRPDGLGYVLRVDGHDQHVLATPVGAACEAFYEVVRHDAEIARDIEAAWEQHGLNTLRGFIASHAQTTQRFSPADVVKAT
ncbi:MAG TPA: hypothetical protein VLI90_07190 [Tepidisphaeraceae bacterium]|nr:hypothetical protein [Tepidisphaeraceae bacterium]